MKSKISYNLIIKNKILTNMKYNLIKSIFKIYNKMIVNLIIFRFNI